MTSAPESSLNSLKLSVGSDLEGEKAAHVLKKLASREADRRAQLTQQAENSRASAAPDESCKTFLLRVDAWQQHTQAALERISDTPQQELEIKEQLEQLLLSLSEQEQAAAQASYYLPSYDARQVASVINSLREQIEAVKKANLGKKKFGFSRKPKKSSERKPSALAEAQNTPAKQSMMANNTTQNSSDCSVAQRRWGLSDLQQQTINVNAEELAGREYSLTNLTGCTVHLQGPMSALQIRNLADCLICTGPVSGPTFVHGAQDCTFKLASHQIRIHNAHRCKVHLRARSNPIIEHSDTLQFAPYSPDFPGCTDQLKAAGLDQDNELWKAVQDFGWLKQTQSPNWCIMPAQGDRIVDG
ncbi:hypothetical protein ABBQ32_012098 [Trebouxia sp. C0010 RCD-2024]